MIIRKKRWIQQRLKSALREGEFDAVFARYGLPQTEGMRFMVPPVDTVQLLDAQHLFNIYERRFAAPGCIYHDTDRVLPYLRSREGKVMLSMFDISRLFFIAFTDPKEHGFGVFAYRVARYILPNGEMEPMPTNANADS